MFVDAVDQHGIDQGLDDFSTGEPAPDLDRQAAPGVFIDQSQQPQAAAFMGGVMNEIVGPHVVGMGRP